MTNLTKSQQQWSSTYINSFLLLFVCLLVYQADAPNTGLIPESDAVGVTVVLITCTYRSQEFIRIGYYVNNEYTDPELRENPPIKPDYTQVRIMTDFWDAMLPRLSILNVIGVNYTVKAYFHWTFIIAVKLKTTTGYLAIWSRPKYPENLKLVPFGNKPEFHWPVRLTVENFDEKCITRCDACTGGRPSLSYIEVFWYHSEITTFFVVIERRNKQKWLVLQMLLNENLPLIIEFPKMETIS